MTYFIGPVLSLGLLVLILFGLLNRKLRERHAIWWALGALVALILSLFPSTLEFISTFLGFEAPLNFVLILATAVIFLVSLQHSRELTELESKVRTLTEHIAMLEMESEKGSQNSE